jgi:hypothetical protein
MSEEQRDDVATDDAGERESFLTRWSERKALARQGAELPEAPQDPAAEAAEESPQAEAVAPGDAADEPPELPPIESLDEDSDYSPFLAAGVSPDVQRDALRKLFRSPKFNVRDGLDDYDLDFTNPEPLGDIVTAEMRRRIQIELERLAGLDEEGEAPEETVTAADDDDNQEIGEPVDTVEDDEQPRSS